MPEFVIEREIPGVGQMSEDEIRDVSMRSLDVLKSMGSQIQWLHSYVTDDRLYCVYLAPDEACHPRARAAARRAGQPDLGRAPADRPETLRLSALRSAARPQCPAGDRATRVRPSFQAFAYASSLMRVRALANVRSTRSRSAGLARRADPQADRRGAARQPHRLFVARLATGAPRQRFELTGDAALVPERAVRLQRLRELAIRRVVVARLEIDVGQVRQHARHTPPIVDAPIAVQALMVIAPGRGVIAL